MPEGLDEWQASDARQRCSRGEGSVCGVVVEDGGWQRQAQTRQPRHRLQGCAGRLRAQEQCPWQSIGGGGGASELLVADRIKMP
mmetsp:Transcript_14875/g.35301  ORF Transcript_14875/g.35301 Transcript_14875/m.35301 type:complete len:84 (+) Transcript_14875:277-528(+)